MATPKVLSESSLTMAEVKTELEKIKKRDKELNFRAQKTEDYLQQFVTIKNISELVQKLEKLNIPRLKDLHINKIVDLMPKSIKSLKMVLQEYTITVNNDNLKKIVDAINGFLEKK